MSSRRVAVLAFLAVVPVTAACGTHGIPSDSGSTDGADVTADTSRLSDTAPTDAVDAPPSDAPPTDVPPPDAGPPPPLTCTMPIGPAPTPSPHVVGTGTPASCTAAALATTVGMGGAITFNCGGPATITVASEITLPADHDTVIDGGNMITLDGGGTTRILHYRSGDYRGMFGGPEHTVTLQHLTLTHARATGTAITVPAGAPAACSRGTGTDGGGGGILVENGVLHVIDCVFTDNHAAQLGPDVAGGGVYAMGSTDVTIVSSRFAGNSASNGGAVGCLNSDLTIANDTFDGSQSTGMGENSVDPSMCPMSINNAQVGSGGNGGAISIDGGSDGTVTICGCTFTHNTAGALGGAMFRTPDRAMQTMRIDQTTFDGNSAPAAGGGVMYLQNSMFVVTNTTMSNNRARLGGAIQAYMVQFQFTNDTIAGNTATSGLGGAFFATSSTGGFTNCTVANNQAQSTMMYQAFGGASFGTAFTWTNTLIVDNTDNSGNGRQACDVAGANAHSIQWPSMASTGAVPPCATGITFADPMLGTLGNHGGSTATMVPSAPASTIQIGTGCPATDQTGHARAMPCTAGAYEVRL